ncbi:unnamed protein product [Microthlaspi erraticum]|uniref:Uncharacterized protein n=1 Tax=Microthlaspi erraticum TaxID=1685480 RepID=A0A6D2JVP0_9BRAS|nr:unnamed protein product [Microthlaspi erraticum]
MRIEGEKGVKTQSAPKHWPRTRKKILAEQFHLADRPVEPGRNSRARPDTCATETVRAQPRQEERPRSAEMYRNGPTVPVDPGNKRSASAEILGQNNLADQIARPRQNPSAIGPNFSRPR